ncbi:MAG: hypothetical protein AAF479_06055 [Pseudomonadota bacterium]
MKQAGIMIVAGAALTACAQQGGSTNQAAAPDPAPTPAPVQQQASYNLNGGSMTVVTEPAPAVRRTSASLDLVQSKTLLDVARQATVRISNADAGPNSVINAVALPTTDIALRIEQILLGRLGNVFSLAVKVNQVGNPGRSFPFTPDGAQELAGKLNGAGLRGYALDARTEYLDLETTGGTIESPVEQFSLSGKVEARLIDISTGAVIRQAVCINKQQMGTLRDIFVAEGKPVPQSAALAKVATPAPAPASAQAPSGSARPASETSAAALALIEKTGQEEKSQRLEEPTAPSVPLPEATATAAAEVPAPEAAPADPAPAPAAATVAEATPAPEVVEAPKPIALNPPATPAPEVVAAVQTPAAPVQSEADAQAEAGSIAAQAAAAVTAPRTEEPRTPSIPEPQPALAATVAEPAQSTTTPSVQAPETPTVAAVTPEPAPVAIPTPQPTAEDRVQEALRQAAPSRTEVIAQQQAAQAPQEAPRNVPIRRTGAFAGVVQSALEEEPEGQVFRTQRQLTVQGTGVKQKARLDVAALALAQATAPITYPGPGKSGRVSDGAADRLIRKCTEELWQQIVPK